MDLVKFLPHPLIIAVLAGLMQLIDLHSNCGGTQYFYAWAGFASWACYFLAGCKVSGGCKSIMCWVAGIVAAYCIATLVINHAFDDGTPNKPLICLIVAGVAFVVILFEKIPVLDFIPAWFIGAACYFATWQITGDHKVSVIPVVIAAVTGQIFGFVTVLLRTKYQAMIEPAGEENKTEA